MSELKYPHIQKLLSAPACLARIPRVRVAQIVADHLGYGWSAEEIVRQYPHLSRADVDDAFAYYLDHREEIDQELAGELDAIHRAAVQPASPLRRRLLSLRGVIGP